MNYVCPSECTTVEAGKIDVILECLKVMPFHTRKLKGTSPGFDQILTNEYKATGTAQKTVEPISQTSEDKYLGDLIELVWTKIQERHRNVNDGFRFFDWKGKGKIYKSSFINGLEKLRIRLQASDIDLIWQYLDNQKRGFLTFNSFLAIEKRPVMHG